MTNITIIGGSGFVGKSLLAAYNRNILQKFRISNINVVCRKPNLLKKYPKLLRKKIRLIKGDIGNLTQLPKSDLILYAADTTNIEQYFDRSSLKKNKKKINNFIKIVKKSHKHSKILYLSSGAVIKNNSLNSYKNYKNSYQKIKFYSERKISELSKFQISNGIARCYTFIGEWLPLNKHFAIGNFLNDIIKKKTILVKSKKKTVRSYMYSDDMILWLIKIGLNLSKKTQIFDVGSDQGVDMRDLASLMGRMFKRDIRFTTYTSKKSDVYLPNIKITKKKFNLKINYNLKKSIYTTIKRIKIK